MNLVRMIYVSRMTEDCDMESIQSILEISRKNNKVNDITGVLCYDPAFFLQCLEGPRHATNELYRSIVRNHLHRDVEMLEYCETKDRLFAEWAMGFLAAIDVNKKVLEKYTGSGKFDPYQLTAQQARDFLVEIVARGRKYLSG